MTFDAEAYIAEWRGDTIITNLYEREGNSRVVVFQTERGYQAQEMPRFVEVWVTQDRGTLIAQTNWEERGICSRTLEYDSALIIAERYGMDDGSYRSIVLVHSQDGTKSERIATSIDDALKERYPESITHLI